MCQILPSSFAWNNQDANILDRFLVNLYKYSDRAETPLCFSIFEQNCSKLEMKKFLLNIFTFVDCPTVQVPILQVAPCCQMVQIQGVSSSNLTGCLSLSISQIQGVSSCNITGCLSLSISQIQGVSSCNITGCLSLSISQIQGVSSCNITGCLSLSISQIQSV